MLDLVTSLVQFTDAYITCLEIINVKKMKKDMELRPEMAMDREKWRCGIMRRTSDPYERENNRR